MGKLLWWIISILIVIWVFSLLFKIGGGLIHIILVLAGILFFVQLLAGRKSL
ncbi:lmo0937 family membrane protein [Viridibacillus sp. NPDC093762]|uniref:lmo0937 family membrane protein n=1 Tax=Viridibacillus sp. NPDC093762 TaxID=3390720 RepID=UPI003CFC8DE0